MDLSGNQGEETQVTKKRRGDKETNVGGQQPCLADPDNDGEETTQRDGENEEDIWEDYRGEEEEWEEGVSQHHPNTQSLLTDLTAEEGGGTQLQSRRPDAMAITCTPGRSHVPPGDHILPRA